MRVAQLGLLDRILAQHGFDVAQHDRRLAIRLRPCLSDAHKCRFLVRNRDRCLDASAGLANAPEDQLVLKAKQLCELAHVLGQPSLGLLLIGALEHQTTISVQATVIL